MKELIRESSGWLVYSHWNTLVWAESKLPVIRLKGNHMNLNAMTETAHQIKATSPAMDIDDYFERIHYKGDRNPTLNTLQSIHMLHPRYIPFENLNPLLQIPVKLDLPSLSDKLLARHRGGYCFEQNLLLKAVLESLGFRVKGLAARVLWGQHPDVITARGHMLLLVEIDSVKYIADVGFGGQTLTAPLLLKTGVTQQTPHEPFRLVQIGDEYRLETEVRGEWNALYRFGLMENFQVDYEVTSWYLSNHPASHFVSGLIAARTEPGKRYALRNNELAIHHLNGNTEKKIINDPEELERILKAEFYLSLEETDRLKIALKRICRV